MRSTQLRPHIHQQLSFLQRPARTRWKHSLRAVSYMDSPATVIDSSKRSPLKSTDLHRAASLARLSGLCYYPADQLEWRLQKEGLKLITSGDTPFTRWYVADGIIDSKLSRPQNLQTGTGPEPQQEVTPEDSSFPISEGDEVIQEEGEVERIIMLRGVVWRGEGVDSFKLWQDLMRFWPTPFAKDHTEPKGALLAHAGAADMAERVYDSLKVAVTEGVALNRRITFGGHSLGGSLANLLMVLFRVRLGVPRPYVTTFGSPPVLSHKQQRGGDGVMQVLGLKRSAIRNYVLENDPVPRALLSIDPTFTALKSNRAGAAFLQLRQWLVGPTALTPERFLADNVGEVYLLKWSAESGHEVISLAPEEIEKELLEAAGGSASSFQRVVDHAHGSYSTDLDAAAWQLQTRGL